MWLIWRGYFATIYNKNGEGNRFTGTVRSYLADDMILAGSAFWPKSCRPKSLLKSS